MATGILIGAGSVVYLVIAALVFFFLGVTRGLGLRTFFMGLFWPITLLCAMFW